MNVDINRNDNNTDISYFKKEIKNFIDLRKWSKYHTPKNLIQAMNIELSELSELFLFKNIDKNEIYQDEIILKNIKTEIADVFIYLVSFINSLDIDLTSAFIEKMKKNRVKYSIEEFNDGNFYKK
ncbi:MAG: nucleotide pyrophosphohydrolase [Candidatus Lokiarchaeota archaeon]|nr:nucleotide pyrophosphohydrolase [Candidatus Lokiarchaeota archaeon]